MHQNVVKYLDPIDEDEQRLLRAETFLHFQEVSHWNARNHIRICSFCSRLYRFGEHSKNNSVCSEACRVWSKILVGDEDECWPFMSSRDSAGYGWLNLGGSTMKAHRMTFKFANGHLPEWTGKAEGPVVMHMCDNRACCNPNHLKIGTQDENISDMMQKGRWRTGRQPTYEERPRGENHSKSLVTEDTARYILESTKTASELAEEIGVNLSLVKQIRQGRCWSHVTHTPPNKDEVESHRKAKQLKAISRPVVIDGVSYPSKYDARKALDVSSYILDKMIRKPEPKPGNKKKVEYDGVVYESKEAAVKAIGVARKTLDKWITLGKAREVQ